MDIQTVAGGTFEQLYAHEVARVSAASLSANESAWEELWRRFRDFQYRRTFFAQRRSRTGRAPVLSTTEQSRRLAALFGGRWLRGCFVQLDLRSAPTDVLASLQADGALWRMPFLERILYPSNGWVDKATRQQFEAAIPAWVHAVPMVAPCAPGQQHL